MRHLPMRIGLLLAAGSSLQASAAVLPFTGSLQIQPPRIQARFYAEFSGTGSATLNGSLGGGHLSALKIPAGVFMGFESPVCCSDPTSSPITRVNYQVTNGTGNFSGPPGAGMPFGGVMPVRGLVTICLFSSECAGGPGTPIFVPLTAGGTRGVGIGGAQLTSSAFNGALGVSVQGAPWTVGTAAAAAGPIGGPVTFLTRTGFAHGPASATSSTANPSGTLLLVTPIQLTTTIGPSGSLPMFAVMTLHFAPEPGQALLLGAGLLWFLILGHRRWRQ